MRKQETTPQQLHIPVRLRPLVVQVLEHRETLHQSAQDCLAICLARGLEAQLEARRELAKRGGKR